MSQECMFCLTGSTKEHLLKGIKVELDTSMNPDQCNSYLLKILQNNGVNIEGKQLLIYLSGGIPFIGGTLGDIYLNKDVKNKKAIYGVLTLPIPSTLLDKPCLQICNVSDSDHQILFSPQCNSTEKGLSDIACLLGYFKHDGQKSDLFFQKSYSLIGFIPFFTTLYRIIEDCNLVGRDIVTFCSTLFTFFRSILPLTVPDNEVFEYTFKICNVIMQNGELLDKNPILLIEVKEDQPNTKFLSDLKLGPQVYFWMEGEYCISDSIAKLFESFEKVEGANQPGEPFTPIHPLSTRFALGCSIVRGKKHEYLYLMRSLNKNFSSQEKVDIIDPLTGLIESKDVESFAKEQENANCDNLFDLFEKDSLKEIIMINFDESEMMLDDLKGNFVTPCDDKVQRITIATQYLSTFINRIYGYRIQSVLGFVSFNEEITLRCPISPIFPEFESKALKDIQPKRGSKLWDSLLYSCRELVKFKKEKNIENKYDEFRIRIIVFSNGVDSDSEAKIEEVVKELKINKIIVDSIIINDSEEDLQDCQMLSTISHITNGLSFKLSDISEGLSIIQKNGFLNSNVRRFLNLSLIPGDNSTRIRRIKTDQITIDFLDKVNKHAYFDNEVTDNELSYANSQCRLATPRHICYMNIDSQIRSPQQRRILKELRLAAQYNDEKSGYFDAGMKIFPGQANLDRWKVFIKGLENTPFANKWWYMYVTFPELYPIQPPIFRFISVPYHLNISSDGRFCHNVIEKGYFSAKHVVDIIQELKELLLLPNLEMPIRIDAYLTFLNDPHEYERRQRISAESNAVDDYNEYIKNVFIYDEVKNDFVFQQIERVPAFLMSQLKGKPIKKEKMVLASSGVYYDRDELKELIASNKNPICVVTGKPLTEKVDDI